MQCSLPLYLVDTDQSAKFGTECNPHSSTHDLSLRVNNCSSSNAIHSPFQLTRHSTIQAVQQTTVAAHKQVKSHYLHVIVLRISFKSLIRLDRRVQNTHDHGNELGWPPSDHLCNLQHTQTWLLISHVAHDFEQACSCTRSPQRSIRFRLCHTYFELTHAII